MHNKEPWLSHFLKVFRDIKQSHPILKLNIISTELWSYLYVWHHVGQQYLDACHLWTVINSYAGTWPSSSSDIYQYSVRHLLTNISHLPIWIPKIYWGQGPNFAVRVWGELMEVCLHRRRPHDWKYLQSMQLQWFCQYLVQEEFNHLACCNRGNNNNWVPYGVPQLVPEIKAPLVQEVMP